MKLMVQKSNHLKQHLWCYEYDYKCDRCSLVKPTVAVKQLDATSTWCIRL